MTHVLHHAAFMPWGQGIDMNHMREYGLQGVGNFSIINLSDVS